MRGVFDLGYERSGTKKPVETAIAEIDTREENPNFDDMPFVPANHYEMFYLAGMWPYNGMLK